jgi:hypothetical protein
MITGVVMFVCAHRQTHGCDLHACFHFFSPYGWLDILDVCIQSYVDPDTLGNGSTGSAFNRNDTISSNPTALHSQLDSALRSPPKAVHTQGGTQLVRTPPNEPNIHTNNKLPNGYNSGSNYYNQNTSPRLQSVSGPPKSVLTVSLVSTGICPLSVSSCLHFIRVIDSVIICLRA